MPPAETLHRLLGFSPKAGTFSYHQNNPLSASYVIVDECSMIDLFLMERLCRALLPESKLILLGDPDQLPSVEAGAVFRDLVEFAESRASEKRRWFLRLKQSFRMDPADPRGRAILSVAERIHQGEVDRLFDAPLVQKTRSAELQFAGVEWLSAARLPEFLDTWFHSRITSLFDFRALLSKTFQFEQGLPKTEADRQDLQLLFLHFERARILCAIKSDVHAAGAGVINRALHEIAAREGFESAHADFLVGEPVMMQHNDYHRGLFNGDQGLILNVLDREAKGGRVGPSQAGTALGRPMIVFPRRTDFAVFDIAAISHEVRLSYAMTIHKSQGSEFDHTAIVLPDTDLGILGRDILYTAVTRSRRSVVLLGEEALFKESVKRKQVRHTGLKDELSP